MTRNHGQRHWMDGIDFWTYGVLVQKGDDGFLQYAPKKESLSHSWPDQNGTEVDLSQQYLDVREVTLQCALFADSEVNWWKNYNNFIGNVMKPGKRRITINQFGNRDYYVYFKNCNIFTRVTRLPESQNKAGIWAANFSITVVENEPKLDAAQIFLVTEEGTFIIL